MKHRLWLQFLLVLCLPASLAVAQTPPTFPVPHEARGALQQVAATEIEITYGRPALRGRTVFGEVVPWGQVWRTGSYAATRISFSTPVAFNGIAVDSGAYELFTIPGEREWVVILQRSRSQWGSYAYDPAHDVARVTARPTPLPERVESFTLSLDDVTSRAATLHLAWDRVRLPVRITVDLEATVVPRLEAALRADGRRPYFQAAMFYYENDLDLDRAAELMALALQPNPDHIGMLYRQALILERKGDRPGAIAAAKRSRPGRAPRSANCGRSTSGSTRCCSPAARTVGSLQYLGTVTARLGP